MSSHRFAPRPISTRTSAPADEQPRITALVRQADAVADAWRETSGRASAVVASALVGLLERHDWPRHACCELVLRGPQNGLSLPANDEKRGMPTLSLGAIQDGQVVPVAHTKWADVSAERAEPYLLKRHDVLVVRGNGNRDLAARCGIVDELPGRYFYPDLLIRLIFDLARIRPEFAALQWNSATVQRQLTRRAKSTNGIWKVNGKDCLLYTSPSPRD